MIYFENYYGGRCGLNNHVVPYTLCISLSNFLDRDFYFANEQPPSTPPEFAVEGSLKDKFSLIMRSPRANVSDLMDIPARRVFEVDREVSRKTRIDDPTKICMSDELFMAQPGSRATETFFTLGREIVTRETLEDHDLVEIGDMSLINVSYFYFLDRARKDALLKSVRLKYRDDIELLAARIIAEIGRFDAIHLRLGDFLRAYTSDGFSVEVDDFRDYLDRVLDDSSVPVLIATDVLGEKELFEKLLPDRRRLFIDEIVFGDFEKDFADLAFTDFGTLAVLNQLISAAGERFVGTCRSTFTSMIHRLRQERWGKKDFNFFPDRRVAVLLDENGMIKPDRSGFFDWNRYSVFSEDYRYPAWMREWDFDLTSLN